MATKTTKSTKASRPTANGPPPPSSEILTLAEAAAFLRVPEEGLKADADAGRIPARLVAGQWRFNKTALLAWLSLPETESVGGHWKDRIRELIGAWKDDPTVDAMVEEIYRERKRHPVGG